MTNGARFYVLAVSLKPAWSTTTDRGPGPLQTFATTITLCPGLGEPDDLSVVPDADANQKRTLGQSETADQQDLPIEAGDNSHAGIIVGATIGTLADLAAIAIAIALRLYAKWRCVGVGEDVENAISIIWGPAKDAGKQAAFAAGACKPWATDLADNEGAVVVTAADKCEEGSRVEKLLDPVGKGGKTKPAAAAKLGVVEFITDDFVIYADTFVTDGPCPTSALNAVTTIQAAARRARCGSHTTNYELNAEGTLITSYSSSPRSDGNLVTPPTTSLETSNDEVICVKGPSLHLTRHRLVAMAI
jgi:hypothetical protein